MPALIAEQSYNMTRIFGRWHWWNEEPGEEVDVVPPAVTLVEAP